MQTNENLSAVAQRLHDLRAKLAAREDQPAYRDNVPMLKQEIARLEQITVKPVADKDC